jgi:hypothetical protein
MKALAISVILLFGALPVCASTDDPAGDGVISGAPTRIQYKTEAGFTDDAHCFVDHTPTHLKGRAAGQHIWCRSNIFTNYIASFGDI